MTDEIFISDLMLEDETDGRPPPAPGLWVGEPCENLELIERLWRECPISNSYAMLFTTEDADGNEVFEDDGEARRWQKIMGWEATRPPTVTEAWQYKLYNDARGQAWAWAQVNGSDPPPAS